MTNQFRNKLFWYEFSLGEWKFKNLIEDKNLDDQEIPLKKEANLQTKFSNDFFDVINNLKKKNYNKKERLKFID